MHDEKLTIIGRAELISFPQLHLSGVPAKIDTGANASSIWASDVQLINGHLSFRLFGEGSPFYTGQLIRLEPGQFTETIVENSFGHQEQRYAVRLSVDILGRRIRARFTLADRANKLYPILLGRKLLSKKFLVDVSAGHPLHQQERARRQQRQQLLNQHQGASS